MFYDEKVFPYKSELDFLKEQENYFVTIQDINNNGIQVANEGVLKFLSNIVEKIKYSSSADYVKNMKVEYREYRNYYSVAKLNKLVNFVKKESKYDISNAKDIKTLFDMWKNNDYVTKELNFVTYKKDKSNIVFNSHLVKFTPEDFDKLVIENKNYIKMYGNPYFGVRNMIDNYNNQENINDLILDNCTTYGTYDKMKITYKWFLEKFDYVKNADKNCIPEQEDYVFKLYNAVQTNEAKAVIRDFGFIYICFLYYWAATFILWCFVDIVNLLAYKALVASNAMKPSEATFGNIITSC